MAGNLKVFMGFDSHGVAFIDHYAVFLREMGSAVMGYGRFLWLVRIVLLGSVLIHITMAIQLVQRNRESRGEVRYAVERYSAASIASLSMAFGGTMLLFFIVFHILHFTTGSLHFRGFIEGHVYANVYSAFQSPPLVAFYTFAMSCLGLHLYHGIWSMFQTLGVDAKGWNKKIRCAASVIAIVVCLGFSSVPLAIFFNIAPPPTDQFMTHQE